MSQDVLLAALQGASEVRSGWPRWLRGAARNMARSQARRAGRRRRREGRCARPEALPSTAERAARLELEMRLIGYVRDLPEGQSEVVYLRFWEGLPPRTIAARLCLPVEAVKTRLKRALASLRARLTEETPGGREKWLGALGFAPLSGSLAKSSVLGTVVGGIVVKKIVALVVLAIVSAGVWWAWPERESLSPAVPEQATPTVAASTPREDPGSAPVAGPAAEEPVRVPLVGNTTVVTGRVLDRATGDVTGAGTPVAGVRLHLRPAFHGLGSSRPETETTSDEDGSFQLELTHDWDESQLYAVETENVEEYTWARQEIRIGGDEPRAAEVILYRYANGDLLGTTVDLEGAPVAGVEVRAPGSGGAVTVSDVNGVFLLEGYRPGRIFDRQLAAHKSGWSLVKTAEPTRSSDGSWPEVRLVLARTGTLLVRVEDSDGRPVEGAALSIEPSPAEEYGNERALRSMGSHVSLGPDEQLGGEAFFADVWCGMKLRINLQTETRWFTFERELDGVALPIHQRDLGRPIVVAPEAEHSVILRMAPTRRVSGRVVHHDLTPVAEAYVKLRSAEHRFHAPDFVDVTEPTDEEGRFEIEVLTTAPPGLVLLSASTSDDDSIARDDEAAPQAASMILDLERDHPGLTLVLQPTFAISGRVVGPDGEGLSAKVSVTPSRAGPVPGYLSTGFRSSASIGKDGVFHLAGLPEGTFDLCVRNEDYAPALLTGIATGTSGLVVELEGRPTCVVEIEVVAPGCELEQVIVLNGTLYPVDADAVVAPDLPASASHDEPFGWPESALGLWYGSEGDSIDLGRCLYQYWPISGTETTIAVSDGFRWFGAKARTVDGNDMFPIGTGLVRVTPGTHRLRFELRPTERVTGRVVGVPEGTDPHVAITTLDGRLVPIDVRRDHLGPTLELGANGSFLFKRVPVGRYELRVGTRSALLAGESRLRREIEVRRDKPLHLELEL